MMVDHSDSTMIYSQQLLGQEMNECNIEYIFDHDTLINHNTIRILRAQTEVRLGNFNNAELELLEVQDLDCDLNIQTVVECLNSLE